MLAHLRAPTSSLRRAGLAAAAAVRSCCCLLWLRHARHSDGPKHGPKHTLTTGCAQLARPVVPQLNSRLHACNAPIHASTAARQPTCAANFASSSATFLRSAASTSAALWEPAASVAAAAATRGVRPGRRWGLGVSFHHSVLLPLVPRAGSRAGSAQTAPPTDQDALRVDTPGADSASRGPEGGSGDWGDGAEVDCSSCCSCCCSFSAMSLS
jgi:hypothetical protein